MHIPSSTLDNVDIMPFDLALKEALEPQPDYDSGKWLYVPCKYSEYRYILGTHGDSPLICIGINPSTAKPDQLDNTLKSTARIAEGNNFASWLMFNVYPQRATRPEDMDRELDPRAHRENMAAWEYVLKNSKNTPAVWAAWGAIIEKRPYLKDCLRDMIAIGQKYNARWFRAGKLSVKGHPHHPLYLRKDEKLVDFDVEGYLNRG